MPPGGSTTPRALSRACISLTPARRAAASSCIASRTASTSSSTRTALRGTPVTTTGLQLTSAVWCNEGPLPRRGGGPEASKPLRGGFDCPVGDKRPAPTATRAARGRTSLSLVISVEQGVQAHRARVALERGRQRGNRLAILGDQGQQPKPELDPRKVKDFATLSFVEAKADAALLGPPGVGKTHIAVALAVAACRAGYSVYFTSLDDMVRNRTAAETAGRVTWQLPVAGSPCSGRGRLPASRPRRGEPGLPGHLKAIRKGRHGLPWTRTTDQTPRCSSARSRALIVRRRQRVIAATAIPPPSKAASGTPQAAAMNRVPSDSMTPPLEGSVTQPWNCRRLARRRSPVHRSPYAVEHSHEYVDKRLPKARRPGRQPARPASS